MIGVCLFDTRDFVRSPGRAHTTATPFKVAAGQTLPRMDVIYAHAGMSPDLIDAAVANGSKGTGIAGVGVVQRNIEVADDKIGTVASMELNPAKARVLLKLALTQASDVKKIQEFFNTF